MYVRMYVFMYVCMHVCMYVCLYVWGWGSGVVTLSPCPDFATYVAQDLDALCAAPGKRRFVNFQG